MYRLIRVQSQIGFKSDDDHDFREHLNELALRGRIHKRSSDDVWLHDKTFKGYEMDKVTTVGSTCNMDS